MTQPKKEQYRRKLPHFQQPGQWYSITFTLIGAMPKGAMHKYSMQLETARNQMEELRSRESDFPKSDIFRPGNFSLSATLESCSPDLRIGNPQSQLTEAKKKYQIALRKYRLAYDKILNKSKSPGINLLKEDNRKVIEEALLFWEGKRLANHAWCIMGNHVHWIITVFDKAAVVVRESDNPLSDSFTSATLESYSPDLRLGNPQSRESEFPKSDIFAFGKSKSLENPIYLQDILHSVKLFTARRINGNENCTGQLWEHESFDTTIRNDSHFMNVFNYVIQNPVSARLVKDWRQWPGTRVFGDEEFLHP